MRFISLIPKSGSFLGMKSESNLANQLGSWENTSQNCEFLLEWRIPVFLGVGVSKGRGLRPSELDGCLIIGTYRIELQKRKWRLRCFGEKEREK